MTSFSLYVLGSMTENQSEMHILLTLNVWFKEEEAKEGRERRHKGSSLATSHLLSLSSCYRRDVKVAKMGTLYARGK
jgi:hypothetical protein